LRVSIDTVFYKNELLRTSVHVLRTLELDTLEIFKAVVARTGKTAQREIASDWIEAYKKSAGFVSSLVRIQP
jgi:hypothetical protein